MFKRALLTVLLGTFLFSCAPKRNADVCFQIAPIMVDSIPQLQITMRLKADPSGTTSLSFPNEAWGETDLYHTLGEMQLLNVEGVVEKDTDSSLIVLVYPKDTKELEFQYHLKQDSKGEISTRNVYRPVINNSYFHVFSHNMFMLPEHSEDHISIAMDWSQFPETYTIHNSFGSRERKQLLKDMDTDKFGNAIFVGGDFRILEGEINGNKISLATRGDWVPFNEEDVFKVLEQTLTYQRNFWDDHSQTYFTVTMQPFPQEMGSSFQGTGLTNSFATSVSNNDMTDIEQMVYLFNHELMHNWIGHAITAANEEEQYWFSEGFTEYYTFKNIARNHINGLGSDYYISEINRTIRDLYASPVMAAPNAEINYDNFWTNPDYSKLPYCRGALFAFYLDQTLQKNSKGKQSLDDVMHQIFADATNGQKVDHPYFIKVMAPFWKGDFEAFFQKHIVDGVPIDLYGLFDDLGWEYSPMNDIYQLGFEFTEDRKAIKSVVEGSAAWEAGLKVGDSVFSRSIWQGSIDHQVELGILRDGEKMQFSYYPVTTAEVPQIKPTATNGVELGF